ncbi:MAG: hypothetical protein AAGC74_13160 [Verrucomicrobiota bacterium]
MTIDQLRANIEDQPTNTQLRLQLARALLSGHAEQLREAVSHLQQASRNPQLREEALQLSKQALSKLGIDDDDGNAPPPAPIPTKR